MSTSTLSRPRPRHASPLVVVGSGHEEQDAPTWAQTWARLWGWQLPGLSLGSQWPFIVLAGAGIGLLLGPASTDAVNRAIDASYGEVTGITQTIRNYGSSLGLAVLGAVLISQMATRVTDSLVGLGVPADRAGALATTLSQQGRSGAVPDLSAVPPANRGKVFPAIQLDYAQTSKVVFLGMAAALVVALVAALFHPGGKVVREATATQGATVEG